MSRKIFPGFGIEPRFSDSFRTNVGFALNDMTRLFNAFFGAYILDITRCGKDAYACDRVTSTSFTNHVVCCIIIQTC
jgi:hypothetical protein